MESLSYTWTFKLCRGSVARALRLGTKGRTPKRTHSVKKNSKLLFPHFIKYIYYCFFSLWFFLSEVIRCDNMNSCSVEANKAVVPGVATAHPVNACNTAPSPSCTLVALNQWNQADAPVTEMSFILDIISVVPNTRLLVWVAMFGCDWRSNVSPQNQWTRFSQRQLTFRLRIFVIWTFICSIKIIYGGKVTDFAAGIFPLKCSPLSFFSTPTQVWHQA